MTKMFRSFATYVALLIGLAGLTLVLFTWHLPPFDSLVETTSDAYVRTQITPISSQLGGYVADVLVQDYQAVKEGDLLFRIDERIFRQKLEQAETQLAGQRSALANAEQQRLSAQAMIASGEAAVEGARASAEAASANWSRLEPLLAKGIVTGSEADQARSALAQAEAALHQASASLEVSRQELAGVVVGRQTLEAAVRAAQASVHLAQIDLDNTRILAPRDGVLGEVGARTGQYVSAGGQLASLVPEIRWIVANFKETQLPGMLVGQQAIFTVDALNDAPFTGHVERFSPATGSEFSLIRADNATGNFTKVVQRLPVRISIDPGQRGTERIAPGMSVVVSVDPTAAATPALASR